MERLQRGAIIVGAISCIAFVVFMFLMISDGFAEKFESVWPPFVVGAFVMIIASVATWVAAKIRAS